MNQAFDPQRASRVKRLMIIALLLSLIWVFAGYAREASAQTLDDSQQPLAGDVLGCNVYPIPEYCNWLQADPYIAADGYGDNLEFDVAEQPLYEQPFARPSVVGPYGRVLDIFDSPISSTPPAPGSLDDYVPTSPPPVPGPPPALAPPPAPAPPAPVPPPAPPPAPAPPPTPYASLTTPPASTPGTPIASPLPCTADTPQDNPAAQQLPLLYSPYHCTAGSTGGIASRLLLYGAVAGGYALGMPQIPAAASLADCAMKGNILATRVYWNGNDLLDGGATVVMLADPLVDTKVIIDCLRPGPVGGGPTPAAVEPIRPCVGGYSWSANGQPYLGFFVGGKRPVCDQLAGQLQGKGNSMLLFRAG